MESNETFATALLLTTFGLLLALSVFFSRAIERFGVPVALIFLFVGVLAGSEGIGGIAFDDYDFTFRLGTTALALILFDGGLNTPRSAVRFAAGPAFVLATVGVVGTAAVVALAAYLMGFPPKLAMLLGAIVSSTDAAAVFSVLRGSGINLKRRVGTTLEVESGLNDPMAVILTTVLTANLILPEGALTRWLPLQVASQMVIGGLAGVAIGWSGRKLLLALRLPAGGLYPAFTIAIALIAFGLPTLAYGSGFLAVYAAGVMLGDGGLPYRRSIVSVHDSVAWLSQITMFLLLGLLVYPSRLMEVALPGVILAIVLAFIARPLVVALCLVPFRYPRKELAYIGWTGLRGAVPIILAIIPILAGAPQASTVFDLVFFIVVVNAIVPGGTVAWVTRKLGLESGEPPPPPAVLEIESIQPLQGELISFYIDGALAVAGVQISDLPFPEGSAATLIIRGAELVAPRGNTILEPGDHLYVFARPEDRDFMQLMFGRPEQG